MELHLSRNDGHVRLSCTGALRNHEPNAHRVNLSAMGTSRLALPLPAGEEDLKGRVLRDAISRGRLGVESEISQSRGESFCCVRLFWLPNGASLVGDVHDVYCSRTQFTE